MRVLSVLTWAIRLFIFLFILVLALKNSAPVEVRFFFDHAWQIPLALLIVSVFVAGVLLGVLVMAGVLFRERRVSARLRRDLERAAAVEIPGPES
ncbi:MAG: LapA family protein [Zoogloeaceae bacterium]|jgi:uncharacterized integral membrane protein|nr:LapA family protein [Zoogloeaceae bacterium]